MTLLDAARKGKWVRRRGSTRVLCISETPTNFYKMVRADLLADDWEIVGEEPKEEVDDSVQRFALLELD